MNDLIIKGSELQELELVHFSEYALELNDQEYLQRDHNVKPRGLWVSVENNKYSWSRWCISEQFQLDGLKSKSRIYLKNNADILWLQTFKHLTDFTEEFCVEIFPNSPMMHSNIKWQEVSKICDSIIISPYNWTARLHDLTFWYYGWDCASGCIWNLDAIEKIEVIK